jgi:hypothetical protein
MTTNDKLNRCLKDQTKIGWHHLFFRRIAKTMITFMESHYRNSNNDTGQMTGNQWARKLIQQIWDNFLLLWSQRNSIIHGETKINRRESRRNQLLDRLERCYQFQDQLKLSDKNKIFYKTQEEMSKEDPRVIQCCRHGVWFK